MSSRLPTFISKTKISIICEGPEEYDYLNCLKNLGVWHEHYEIDLINAEGNGNIPARYQDKYQNGSSDLVLVFCDTEKKPYEQYTDIKRKINEFHGIERAADQVIMFGNPCTMQIIITHWMDEKLKSPGKGTNAEIIKKCTGVERYKAKEEQRQQIMCQITKDNYYQMKLRVAKLSYNDDEINSSNFDIFMNYLENEDEEWVDIINQALE